MKSSRLIKLSVASILMSTSLWALSLDEAIKQGLENDAFKVKSDFGRRTQSTKR